MATYTPTTGPGAGTALAFHLLVDPPMRETRQTVSERIIPGSTRSVLDIVGKTVTKIRGQARFDSFAGLKTFEGVVGTQGTLRYSEEPSGIPVIFVAMDRGRVTPNDIHISSVEFWIVPPGVTPRGVTIDAVATTHVGGVLTDVPVANVLSARASFGLDVRTSECRLVTQVKPTCTYDDILTVTLGAGTHNVVRFVGLVRDFEYRDGTATVTTVARGRLVRAIEYENGATSAYNPWGGAGGLLIPDLIGTLGGTAGAIIMAVLDQAGLAGSYDPDHILDSGIVYGAGITPLPFMWRSGGHIAAGEVPQAADQGESAMSYIERYDSIDAEISGANAGGRYRTFETVGGDIFRVRVGGRPQTTPDFTLTEGVDILSGNFTRSIGQLRNYFVVKGQDRGEGFGPLNYGLQQENDFQGPTTQHTFAFSSDMIERADNSADPYQADTGMSCQTLARALALEYNRETVSGWVETFRDDVFGIAQTHLVQGGPGGTVGDLGLAEPVWVQGVEISIDERGFTQRLTYLGGGLPDDGNPDLPTVRAAEEALP